MEHLLYVQMILSWEAMLYVDHLLEIVMLQKNALDFQSIALRMFSKTELYAELHLAHAISLQFAMVTPYFAQQIQLQALEQSADLRLLFVTQQKLVTVSILTVPQISPVPVQLVKIQMMDLQLVKIQMTDLQLVKTL